jgi:hypothetical protein
MLSIKTKRRVFPSLPRKVSKPKLKFPMKLEQEQIKAIRKTCKLIERKKPDNEKSVVRAKGIPKDIQAARYITKNQASWICRNAGYCDVKRPEFLKDFVVVDKPGRAGAVRPSWDEQADDPDAQFDEPTDEQRSDGLTHRLERIETKLDRLLGKL